MSNDAALKRKRELFEKEMAQKGWVRGDSQLAQDGSYIDYYHQDRGTKKITRPFIFSSGAKPRPYDMALYAQSVLGFKRGKEESRLRAEELRLKGKVIGLESRAATLRELQVGFSLARVIIPALGLFILYMLLVGLGAAGLNVIFSGNNIYYFIGIILLLLFFIKKRKTGG